MSEEYVRKELFDETVKRLENRSDGQIDAVLVAIDALKERLDDIKHSQSMSFARWGIATAILICVVQVLINLYLR